MSDSVGYTTRISTISIVLIGRETRPRLSFPRIGITLCSEWACNSTLQLSLPQFRSGGLNCLGGRGACIQSMCRNNDMVR